MTLTLTLTLTLTRLPHHSSHALRACVRMCVRAYFRLRRAQDTLAMSRGAVRWLRRALPIRTG